MTEQHIRRALTELRWEEQYLGPCRGPSYVVKLLHAILNGENTENNEAVVVYARRVTRDVWRASNT